MYFRIVLTLISLFWATSAAVAQQPATAVSSGEVTLLGKVNLPLNITDVWGYAAEGREYALVIWQSTRADRGLLIFDVTNPAQPTEVARVTGVPGFDVKTFQQYAYVVTGGGDRGPAPEGRIIDLSDPANPQVVGSFPSSHNLFISPEGHLFAEYPGLRIFDLNKDPIAPVLLWNTEPADGHDATVIGDRLYDFHGKEGTIIYDISDPAAPVELGRIVDPRIAYNHSGWVTEDGNYLFVCDELAQPGMPDISVWDISDPGNQIRVATISDPNATVHNLHIVGNVAYVSYYTAGFRAYDITNPAQPVLISTYDTAPTLQGHGFGGTWGVYALSPSGTVYVSGAEYNNGTGKFNGSLHLFAPIAQQPTATEPEAEQPTISLMLNNYPNPFTDATTLSYTLSAPNTVQVRIYDAQGRTVTTLADAYQPAGTHQLTWDARDVPPGLYFFHVRLPHGTATRTLTVVR